MKKMTRIDDALQLLNSLIFFTIDGMVKVSKETLFNIQTCLQNAQENIEFLQLETKLQQEELKQRSHFEHVFVKKIETTTHQQQVNNAAVVHAHA